MAEKLAEGARGVVVFKNPSGVDLAGEGEDGGGTPFGSKAARWAAGRHEDAGAVEDPDFVGFIRILAEVFVEEGLEDEVHLVGPRRGDREAGSEAGENGAGGAEARVGEPLEEIVDGLGRELSTRRAHCVPERAVGVGQMESAVGGESEGRASRSGEQEECSGEVGKIIDEIEGGDCFRGPCSARAVGEFDFPGIVRSGGIRLVVGEPWDARVIDREGCSQGEAGSYRFGRPHSGRGPSGVVQSGGREGEIDEHVDDVNDAIVADGDGDGILHRELGESFGKGRIEDDLGSEGSPGGRTVPIAEGERVARAGGCSHEVGAVLLIESEIVCEMGACRESERGERAGGENVKTVDERAARSAVGEARQPRTIDLQLGGVVSARLGNDHSFIEGGAGGRGGGQEKRERDRYGRGEAEHLVRTEGLVPLQLFLLPVSRKSRSHSLFARSGAFGVEWTGRGVRGARDAVTLSQV